MRVPLNSPVAFQLAESEFHLNFFLFLEFYQSSMLGKALYLADKLS